MSEDERERVRELIEECGEAENGATRVGLAEDAVREADRLGDEDLRYDARMELLEATIFGGYPEKALVAFSWLASACDRDPGQFPESASVLGLFLRKVDLLWAYKWVVQNTHGFPQVTRAQVNKTLDDMEARYRKNGVSLRPVWMNRTRIAHALDGPGSEAEGYFAQWLDAPRDLYADCEACEQHFRVDYHLERGDLAAALADAEPLLNGELGCAEVPHITFVKLVIPLAEAGDGERAARHYERGYELCRGNRDFLEPIAELCEYALWRGDLETALSLFRNHAEWVGDCRVGSRRLRWLVVGSALIARVADSDAVAELIARYASPLGVGAGPPAEVSTALARQADEIAVAFDRRNGNTLVSDHVATVRARLQAGAPAT